MQTLYTIHAVDPAKLAGVVAEMRKLGAPTIRVVDCGDYYMALEGVHRLAACAALAIAPILDVLGQDDAVEADSLDWQDLRVGETYTAGELAGEAYSPQSGCYRINEDGTLQNCSPCATTEADDVTTKTKKKIGHMPCPHCGDRVLVRQNEHGTLSIRCDECDAHDYSKRGEGRHSRWLSKIEPLPGGAAPAVDSTPAPKPAPAAKPKPEPKGLPWER